MPRRSYPFLLPVLTLSLLLILIGVPGDLFKSLKASASPSATFTVNSTGDGADTNPGDGVCDDGTGACTLRSAIQEANILSGDDGIIFAASLNGGVITLNTALPNISGNLNIAGPGASLLTIRRNTAAGTPRFRIFTISFVVVNISGLTISNGYTADGSATVNGDHGGAILNNFSSTLNLTNVVITGNATGDGGTGGTGSGSELGGYGGGIFNNGAVVLNGCTVTGNRTGNGTGQGGVGGAGGGIYNIGSLTVINSTISDNITGNGNLGSGDGGGISSGQVLIISNSTINGNKTGNSFSGGGGIRAAVTVRISNSTISGNESNAFGGGLVTDLDAILTNVTITDNRSGNFAGGLYRNGGSLTLQNTIVAGNFRGASPSTTADDISGNVDAASSFNLIGTGGSGGLTNGVNSNQVGVANPGLGTLANNGGSTRTHALLVGSPAIDAGNSALTTDQRGLTRPFDDQSVVNTAGGNASDIGAFEAHTFEVNSLADTTDGLCLALGNGDGCTLRDAVTAANEGPGALIVFAPALTSAGPATITLLSALAELLNSTTITGPGANLLMVQRSTAGGTPKFRIFKINSGATISISGLTLTNGNSADGVAGNFGSAGEDGGGVLNNGNLTLSNLVISSSRTGDGGIGVSFGGSAGKGGGIANFGTLTMTNCTVSGNTGGRGGDGNTRPGDGGSGGGVANSNILNMTNCAVSANAGGRGGDGSTFGGEGGKGGGIYTDAGTANLRGLTVSNNGAGDNGNTGNGGFGGHGGGLAITSGVVTIVDSSISGNHSGTSALGTNGFGGGVLVQGGFFVTGVTVSGNTSSGPGGGVMIQGSGTMSMSNSTVSGNSAVSGGGIFNDSSTTLSLTNATITANAAITGNGISSASAFSARNSIIAANGAAGAQDISGPCNSLGHNLVGNADGSSGFTSVGDQTGTTATPVNPQLDGLANNGGPTLTHRLLSNSPAIDAGDNCVVSNSCSPPLTAALTTDQRGGVFSRIVDGPDANTTATVDIGAFEAQVSVADIADQAINEDNSLSLPFNVGGAASISSVTATSSNTALVPNNPANISISGSGSSRTLLITPVANESGTSTITLTVNGSNSQTMTDTFVLTVNSVNDAPSFTKGPDQTVNESAGAQTINNWATNISVGPANESGQISAFLVTNNSNPGLFASGPAISTSGTLTFTPASGVSGAAIITITIMDNGGTANGGIDTSASQSFNITVLDGGTLAFNSASFNIAEDGGSASITVARSGGSAGIATVQFATSNGTATAADYTSVSQTITFNDGEVSKTVNVAITDDLSKEPDETINLTLSNAGGSGQLGAQSTAVLTILDNDPIGGYLRFASANFNTTESAGSTLITVERVGDTTQAVNVSYATAEDVTVVPCATVNGIASSRCDFTTALGTLRFAAGETLKAFAVLITQDNYVEGPESLTISLSSPSGGANLATPSTATLTIVDDPSEPAANPIDSTDVFVRQHYHDFLNREADAAGLAFWIGEIDGCTPKPQCTEVKRINVSAAFFLSIEFQETGYLVERTYKSGYGDADGTSTVGGSAHTIKVPIVRFSEFLADTQQMGKGVIIGPGDWQTQLENNKVAFTQEFVTRLRFTNAYPTTMTPADFVDALFNKAGVVPSDVERTSIINEFGGAGTSADTVARARALRRVAESALLKQQEKNKAFVLMQYFGYLRRDPNATPDTDHTGYDYWLQKLNDFNGNFVEAEMVKAFISSTEYRQRFGL